MTLKDIFNKSINRPIEGVIKADDEASLYLEIEEYVLTNEVEKRLEAFLDAYNTYEGANGVWVSGFFGSGKSHLLKMLALLLANRQIDRVSTLELFLPKCRGNAILCGDLKRAVAIPSKSILFNIDQKADVISKTEIDALLAVFVKVFDEMCGYYGKQGHIAQFERDLDSRGLYEKFKEAYESTAGRPWHKGREQALLEAKNIAKAYAQATGDNEAATLGILDKYRSEYRVSIEDFANQVHAYIEQQKTPDFRLNFFVDEVGQYIAENVKLMTNLQTIAESLATKCRGRAWVLVTAQEDMETVVGEMGKQQGHDFSKIQDRFKNRMKLTSADVAEVIQKRLLTKTDTGERLLAGIYAEQSNNFKTLFDFTDGSQTYQNYRDEAHFIESYPFIPYQFALFQLAIQHLSQHSAFEGKHSSVGERSMLGVFQHVAKKIGEGEIGQLATFDLMFEGIRTTLKSNIQRAILHAEKHLENDFAVRLLKVLFLVKYVKEFKSTLHNLCVLMLDGFGQSQPALKKRVEEALGLLEQQTYIQRDGELYAYLTDEEKDVEQEIKSTDVDASDLHAALETIVYDHVIKSPKIRYDENGNGQDYSFSKKLDDRLRGKEHELAIHVISPFHENSENETALRTQSMGRDELLVLMSPDDRLMRDVAMYRKTEKYIRQNISTTQRKAVKDILTDKSHQNRKRYDDLQKLVQSLIGKAKLFVAGDDIESASEDAQTRVQQGFHKLIARTYPNLRMLRGVAYTESDIATYLKTSGQEQFDYLSEAEQDLLSFLKTKNQIGIRITLKTLLEHFGRKPYGWYYAAVLCTLAKLWARGKVEVRVDSNLLEDHAELEKKLRNTHSHGNVVLEPQVEFTASQVRALKEFFEDFFNTLFSSSEAKVLGQETDIKFQACVKELTELEAQASRYPFGEALTPVLKKLEKLTGKPSYAWYLTELPSYRDDLLGMKATVLDPLRAFMRGPQRGIFDDAHAFVQTHESNFAYVESHEAAEVVASLKDPACFKGNQMQQVKTHVETLRTKVQAQIKAETAKAKETVTFLKGRLCGMAEFDALSPEQQEQLMRAFGVLDAKLESQKLIAVIRDLPRQFEANTYPQLLARMTAWATPAPAPAPAPKSAPAPESALAPKSAPGLGESVMRDGGSPPLSPVPPVSPVSPAAPPPPPPPPVEYVSSRAVRVSFDKAWLADETDVQRYLESLHEALMEEIRKGKRIQI